MFGIIASIIDGILVGLVYGLAAMGLTLIWGVMDVINLTHGNTFCHCASTISCAICRP